MALIQEYFQSQAPPGSRGPLSPALMKALLINGARSLNRNYDIAAKTAANYQGWGLPSLPNSLTSYSTNQHSGIDERKWRLRYVDQSASNALSTGQSRTWNVTLSSNSVTFPLRVTLVWTDPPGNPAVAVKLVNDLDLVVTNLDTGLVYYGNNIPFGSDMTIASDPLANDPEVRDVINNVEQVMVADPSLLGNRFSITVRARRVNVNAVPNYHAVTGNANDVVQDFALVVSSEIGSNPLLNDPDPSNPNGYLPNLDVFDEFERVAAVGLEARAGLTKITNGLPLLDQRVGANPSLLGGNGAVRQWNFYVFTNLTESNSLVTAIAGSNVAFVTFNPPNLSRPRAIEADIDLYVSTNSALTNLDAAAIATAFKSVDRGGTESVIFTNAQLGDVFYVGVKAEDQEASEFSLIGVSSDQPFEEERNGRIYLYGVPFEAAVLDGNPKRPTAGTMLAIGLSNRRVAHAQVTTTTFHENFPDLVGVLTKDRTRIILNNHSFTTNNFGTNSFIYEDNPAFEQPGITRPSDGPGDLNEVVGYKIAGPWFLEMIDNSPSHTGRVQRFEIAIDPLRDDLLFGEVISGSVDPGAMAFYPLDVPVGVTNLNFLFTVDGLLEFYWREEALPTTNEFDVFQLLTPPGRQFDVPVTANRTYYMGLRNPGAAIVNFTLLITPSYADTNFNRFYAERAIPTVPDVTTFNDVIDVDVDKLVSDVLVGVKMKHPRTADIALTLISPQGSRILLAENRGAGNTAGFGSTITVTNRITNGTTVVTIVTNEPSFLIFTDRTNLTRIPVKFADPASSNSLSGVSFNSGFEFDPAGNYLTGSTLAEGWQVSTGGQVSVISGPGYARSGNGILSLGTAGISNVFSTTPGRPLIVRFSARRARVMDFFSTGVSDTGGPLFPQGSTDPHYYITNGPAPAFQLWGDEPPLQPPAIWTVNGGEPTIPNSFSYWIAPYARVPRTNLMGEFVYRTYVNLYEQTNIAGFSRKFRWAADDLGTGVRINGINYNFPPGLPADFWDSPEHTLPALNPGLNIIDFLTLDTNDVEGLRVDVPVASAQRLRKSPVARMEINIGGNSQTITVTNNWTDYVFTFSPGSTSDILSFQTSTGEVWIDSISVEASGGLFLHPEESLNLLEGERAMGEWRLEVRDTRTGMVLPTGEVLDWSLELTFAETGNPALQMEPGDTVGPITLGSEEVLWVVLDPCQGATFARLQMRGIGAFDELMLFADLNGFPTGNIETDDFIPIPNNEPNGVATFDISTLLPPAARLTGKPIFVGIINQFIGVTNQFELEFTSDGNCSLSGPPPILEPDQPQVGSLDPDPTGGSTTNSNAGIFQFDVPPGARAAIVTVDSTGDVVVYGQKDTIPTSGSFQYRVNDISTAGTETMIIATNSTPALTPGKYFVRVVNNTQQRVNFTINVTFDFGNSAPVTVTISKTQSANPVLQFFPTVPGVTYRIEVADQLSLTPGATVWTLLDTRVATGTVESYEIVSFDFTRPYRFFRITRP
jgi:subtilisin-like proprotein convertase family protein